MKKILISPSVVKRFNTKWGKSETGCWIWHAYKNPKGYGGINLGTTGNRRCCPAHRLSWVIHHHSQPGKLLVLHKCDTPSCVNPDHLFLGTPHDNTQDMIKKGRNQGPRNPLRGSKNGNSKITEGQAQEIKKMLRQGKIARIIAAKVSVTKYVVYDIKRGRTWAHIQEEQYE